MTLYDDGFYDQITEGSVRSARKILPTVIRLFQPKSVVDFGCGTGAWLSVFKENGVDNVLGIDGDYVDINRLLIPHEDFLAHDLTQPLSNINFRNQDQPFDLAMSLEVAEHLPESAADAFVKTLCRASNNILFSAAVPGQNGVNHINEQWPSYWVPKFKAHGYRWSGNFRFQFWHDEEIENWYRQNILLFTKFDEQYSHPTIDHEELVEFFDNSWTDGLDVIHYNNWMGKI